MAGMNLHLIYIIARGIEEGRYAFGATHTDIVLGAVSATYDGYCFLHLTFHILISLELIPNLNVPPLLEQCAHVAGHLAVEEEFLARLRMHEAERARM